MIQMKPTQKPTSVRITVDLHVDLLMKSFSTVRANEWSVVGVSAHVRV